MEGGSVDITCRYRAYIARVPRPSLHGLSAALGYPQMLRPQVREGTMSARPARDV